MNEKSENFSLSYISRSFLSLHKVFRYRMKKVSDMDNATVIHACHCYCEENDLKEEWKQYRKVEEERIYVEAHKHCTNNRDALLDSSVCGCFYCLEVFEPSRITDWIPDTKGTAICPYCGVDSVIGERSGFPVTKEFLGEMKGYWF